MAERIARLYETIVQRVRPMVAQCTCMSVEERRVLERLLRQVDDARRVPRRRKVTARDAKKTKECTWPGCHMTFRDRQDLDNHMWRHTGEKMFTCDECGKKFSAKAYLKKHRDAHDDPFRFKCEFPACTCAFTRAEDLNSHLDADHDGARPFRCDWPNCNKQCTSKLNLQKHRYSHREPKKFTCDACDVAFTKRTQLRAHECVVHGGEKPFKCDWPGCEYETCYEQTLRTHQLRHTGEKPFACKWPKCEWTFRRAHHLQVHMLKHTGEKPFACDWPGCERRFQSRQTLRAHCDKTHH